MASHFGMRSETGRGTTRVQGLLPYVPSLNPHLLSNLSADDDLDTFATFRNYFMTFG